MKTNKYVMINHYINTSSAPDEKFLFKLKKGIKAKVGDIAICETMRGLRCGRITEMFQTPENLEDAVISKYNAYAPIKEVVFTIPGNYYEILMKDANDILRQIYSSASNIVNRIDGYGLFDRPGLPF